MFNTGILWLPLSYNWTVSFIQMPKPSAISVFVAATSLLVASAPALRAQDAGGLKEWTTDQAVDEESVLDSDAAALKKKAEQEDICVPIGEGENCW
ncbi:hypothetical protein [Synechococcus sp. HB1133]|jgi:hypothetical protein|uniref:hypothetical protein n=1 Tax=unclassified Synechococcus TaxID=2626047 RepID=UPI00351AF518